MTNKASRIFPLLVVASLVAFVHRNALSSFFNPEDLLHLEQALDLTPTPPMPWRILTQVLYFRVMTTVVGVEPLPYFAANLLLHLGNCGLLYFLVRRLGGPRSTAALAGVAFGSCPLFVTVLWRAVTISDVLALTGCLATALVLLRRPGTVSGTMVAAACYIVGMLCKEAILLVPLVFLVRWPGMSRAAVVRWRRTFLPLLLLFVTLFFVLRARGLSPTGAPYLMAWGSHVPHNLATYLAWATELFDPLPDLVRSADPTAWRRALLPAALLLIATLPKGRESILVRFGLAWWLLGLAPVLPLKFSTYGHYLYVAHAGLAIGIAGAMASLLRLATLRLPRPLVTRGIPLLLAGIAVLYALRAESLVDRRLHLSIAALGLPADPFLRGIVVARDAVKSVGSPVAPRGKIVLYNPEDGVLTLGARSGRVYRGRQGYDLVAMAIDTGRALRVFYPTLDSVAYLRRWSPAHSDWETYVNTRGGTFEHVGKGLPAVHRLAEMLTERRWNGAAEQLLTEALQRWDDPVLRFHYSVALLRNGKRDSALVQLREVIRRHPNHELSLRSRRILDGISQRAGPAP